MLTIILCLLILAGLYYYLKETEIETFSSSNSNNNNKNRSNNVGIMEELVTDQETMFAFDTKKKRWSYLEDIKTRVSSTIKTLERQNSEISRFIKNHQKNKKILDSMNVKIKPVYKPEDLEQNNKQIKKIKKSYHEHIKSFVKLAKLNNQILTKILYSLEQYQADGNLVVEYHQDKKLFNQEYGQLVDIL